LNTKEINMTEGEFRKAVLADTGRTAFAYQADFASQWALQNPQHDYREAWQASANFMVAMKEAYEAYTARSDVE
jgi:hypothetical protein